MRWESDSIQGIKGVVGLVVVSTPELVVGTVHACTSPEMVWRAKVNHHFQTHLTLCSTSLNYVPGCHDILCSFCFVLNSITGTWKPLIDVLICEKSGCTFCRLHVAVPLWHSSVCTGMAQPTHVVAHQPCRYRLLSLTPQHLDLMA